MTARLRWRSLRNGLFVVVVVDAVLFLVFEKLFWIPWKKCTFNSLLAEQRVHEISRIQSLSTKFVEINAVCLKIGVIFTRTFFCIFITSVWHFKSLWLNFFSLVNFIFHFDLQNWWSTSEYAFKSQNKRGGRGPAGWILLSGNGIVAANNLCNSLWRPCRPWSAVKYTGESLRTKNTLIAFPCTV